MAATNNSEEPTPAGEVLRLEVGDRAFLYAEKYQRDARWWQNEWSRVVNVRAASKHLKGEHNVEYPKRG